MSTLDDKLLGEKTHYYCSSSEDEDETAPKSSSKTTSVIRSENNTDFLAGSKLRTDFSRKWDNSVNVCACICFLSFILYLNLYSILA